MKMMPNTLIKNPKFMEELYLLFEKNGFLSQEKFLVSYNDYVAEYENYLKAGYKSPNTIKDYISQTRKLLSYLEKKNISVQNINIKDIEEYLASNRKNKKTNTFRKLINCLRSFLNFLYKRKYIFEALHSELKPPKKRGAIRRPLEDCEIKKIEKYIEDKDYKNKKLKLRDKIIFYLGIDCGLRRQEIINLKWEDINFDQDGLAYLIIRESKNKKTRLIYFKSLKPLLLELRKLSKTYKGAVIRGEQRRKITKCSLQNAMLQIFKESGVYRKGEISLHSLRYTYATRLRKNGIDTATIQDALGHSDIETTKLYCKTTNEDLKNAAL